MTATGAAAAALAEVVEPGDLILLTGGIGSGKTTFVQALAEALGIQEQVTSPTFMLLAVYESGRIPLSHVDLYRLNSDDEIEEIGFEEYLDTAVTVVEWSERYAGFQAPHLSVALDLGPREADRLLTITAAGGDWPSRLSSAFPESVEA